MPHKDGTHLHPMRSVGAGADRRLGRVLFQKRFWPLIANGSVTVTFRRWRQRQVREGRRYRTPAGFIDVDRVGVVDASEVTDADAVDAGYASAEALLAGLERYADAPLY